MPDKEQLAKQLSVTMGKTKVLELSNILKKNSFGLHDLIDITFDNNKKLAFRAAWLLENVFLQNPEAYLTELEYLISKFADVEHNSCQRHYAKIAMHITAAKAPPAIKQKLQKIDMEVVVNRCFEWLIDPKVLIAVKVFAAEAIFNLRQRYPWVAEELAEQLAYLMRNGSPAIQSRGKKILSYLHPPA